MLNITDEEILAIKNRLIEHRAQIFEVVEKYEAQIKALDDKAGNYAEQKAELTRQRDAEVKPFQDLYVAAYRDFQVGTNQPIANAGEEAILPETPVVGAKTAPLKATTQEETNGMSERSHETLSYLRNAPQTLIDTVLKEFVRLLETKYASAMALAISVDMGKTYEAALGELSKGALTQAWLEEQEVRDSVMPHLRHADPTKRKFDLPIGDNDKVLFSYFQGKGIGSFMAGANYPWALLALNLMRSIFTRNTAICKGTEKSPNVMAILKQALDESITNTFNGQVEVPKTSNSIMPAKKDPAEVQEPANFASRFKIPDTISTWLKQLRIPNAASAIEIFTGGLFQVGYGRLSNFQCPDMFGILGMVSSDKAAKDAATLRGLQTTRAETGGNAPIIVDLASIKTPDDAKKAAELIYASATAVQGERCTSGRRLFLVGNNPEMAATLITEVEKLFARSAVEQGFGDTMVKGTKLGPNYSDAVAAKVAEVVADAKKDGNCRVTQTESPFGDFSKGRYVMPAFILRNVDGVPPAQQHKDMRHEIFGPLMQGYTGLNLNQALGYSNDSPNQLASAVISNSPEFIAAVRSGLKTGELIVNGQPADTSPGGNHSDPKVDSHNGGKNALGPFVGEVTIMGKLSEVREVVTQHSSLQDNTNARSSAKPIQDWQSYCHNNGLEAPCALGAAIG
jgi:acyl-CoA reductase-like NAD-dependent aldehyde dehydrogenase